MGKTLTKIETHRLKDEALLLLLFNKPLLVTEDELHNGLTDERVKEIRDKLFALLDAEDKQKEAQIMFVVIDLIVDEMKRKINNFLAEFAEYSEEMDVSQVQQFIQSSVQEIITTEFLIPLRELIVKLPENEEVIYDLTAPKLPKQLGCKNTQQLRYFIKNGYSAEVAKT